jgi:hypothetical protein
LRRRVAFDAVNNVVDVAFGAIVHFLAQAAAFVLREATVPDAVGGLRVEQSVREVAYILVAEVLDARLFICPARLAVGLAGRAGVRADLYEAAATGNIVALALLRTREPGLRHLAKLLLSFGSSY